MKNQHKILTILILISVLFITVPLTFDVSQIFAQAAITFTEFPITENAYISSITGGPDGNIWFVENITQQGTPTVLSQKFAKITPSGLLTEYPVQNAGNITDGPDGNIWFIANGINSIGKITSSGTITTYSRPSEYDYLRFITKGPDGNIWFTINSGYIGRITPAGVYLPRFTLPNEKYPSGITNGADGNVWFSEPSINKIARITPSGTFTEFSISGAVWGNITTGADGNIWFIERIKNLSFDNYKIGNITPQGIVSEFSDINSSGDNIVNGSDGNIWFSNNQGLANISPDGTSITNFDTSGTYSVSRLSSGPDGNIWFGFDTINDNTDSRIIRVNLKNEPSLRPNPSVIPIPTFISTPVPTIKPTPTATPKPRNIPKKKATPTPIPKTTSTSVNGNIYFCADASDFCKKSFGTFISKTSVKMVCWIDGRTTAEGAYSTNRWFYTNFPDGKEGFVSASTIVSQTVTPHCSSLNNIQATLWAIKQRNSLDWKDKCLSFVRAAYEEAGYSIGPPNGGNTIAIQWWKANDKKKGGVTDINIVPPRGALVFWDGYKTKTADYSDGHVVISLGNGYAISTDERSIGGVHDLKISDRNESFTLSRVKFSTLYMGYLFP